MAVPGKKATKHFSSSTISIGSDEDLQVYCQPCDQDGSRLPAYGYCTNCSEHLCKTCYTLHRKHKLSRDHTLLDKTSMPQTMSPVTPTQSDNFTKPCPKHNMEMIKFYCHDHKALLCSVCVTLEHTATSCQVNYIPDISGQVINSTEYQDILKKIDDMTEKSSKTLQDMKKMNDKSNKSLTDALSELKTFRSKMNQRLDEMERQVEEAAKVIQKDNNKNLMKVETECGDVSKSLKSSSDAIKHFNASKKGNDLFIELKHMEQIIKDYKQSIAKLTEYKVKEYNFEPNEAISNLLDKDESMGTLKERTLNPDLKSRQCSHMDKICIKTSQDNHECTITGMTLLSPDLLIITDSGNSAVKMVDMSKMSVLAQQCFDSTPWEVTSVSQNELAVTLPCNQTIQFLSVSSNNLKKKHTLKVDGTCHGISCHKDKMVVSFLSPAKVQILLINGTVLQTIQDDNIFINPFYITTSDNCIYVSDSGMKTITKLNWQCEVKGKYVCKDKPYGLTMSDDGTVFVCYYDNNTIEEISGDCTKGQVVVKDVPGPQTVVWSAETCTLFTSSYTEQNFIKIFKLSK
ncbi:uncharacterized protein LOC132718267 [Ruditapes philippinarum]|uniref:uncharacterized protein LOC132718267 n=1 Tax=Ruditapes philippinarum TaxID=129788 RepID=UPI00295BC88F|nr:uncharacterized protein LOC132718267 [Ruditapes philippinarum]